MEKQHNRGQEGAGIACVNMDAPVGTEYMFREKALGKDAITEIFSRITPEWTEAQLYMGHLRYSTTGADSNTSTPFCAETTGGPRTSVSAAILI